LRARVRRRVDARGRREAAGRGQSRGRRGALRGLARRRAARGDGEARERRARAPALERRVAARADMTAAAIPRATYRLQLNGGFGFADAAALVPYLAKLGVSHAYFSPYLKTRPGSTHGYDVTDHAKLNPELGTPADYEALCRKLADAGMGQVLDIVPNHVGIMGSEGKWWLDVLEHGQASQFADYFDIDWQPATAKLTNKVLVPVLGDQYGNILATGDLLLKFE